MCVCVCMTWASFPYSLLKKENHGKRSLFLPRAESKTLTLHTSTRNKLIM